MPQGALNISSTLKNYQSWLVNYAYVTISKINNEIKQIVSSSLVASLRQFRDQVSMVLCAFSRGTTAHGPQDWLESHLEDR